MIKKLEQELMLDRTFNAYKEIFSKEGLNINVVGDFKYGFVLATLNRIIEEMPKAKRKLVLQDLNQICVQVEERARSISNKVNPNTGRTQTGAYAI